MKKLIAITMSLVFALSFAGCNKTDSNRDPSKYILPDSSAVFTVGKIDKALTLTDDWSSYLKDENAIYLLKSIDTYAEVTDRNYLSGKLFGLHDGKYLYFYGVVNDGTPLMNKKSWDGIFLGDCIEMAVAKNNQSTIKLKEYFKYIFTKNTDTGEYISDGRPSAGIVDQGPTSLQYMMEKFSDGKGYYFKAIIDTSNAEVSSFLNLSTASEAVFGIFIDNSIDGKALDTENVRNAIWTGHVNKPTELSKMVFAK